MTRDTYTGEEDDPLSLHLYAYCENDGVNAWDPSGHWKFSGHKKITTRVLKKVKSYKNKYNKDKILEGCIFPDQAKNKVKGIVKLSDEAEASISLLGMVIASGAGGNVDNKITGKWHGRVYKGLCEVKRDGFLRVKSVSGHKNGKSKLLGCILHSIEDWYAHSYYYELKNYLKTFEGNKQYYNEKSPQVIYHSDRTEVLNIALKDIDKDEHSRYKDNMNQDFRKDKVTGYWNWKKVSQPLKNNKRVKGAVNECVNYLKAVMK